MIATSYRLTVSIILAFIFLSACSRKQQTNPIPELSTGDSLVAYIEKSPCFGKCPTYSIHIYRSGYTLYNGKSNVARIGMYSTWLSMSNIKDIWTTADKLGYWGLSHEYRDPHLTDFPTIRSSVASPEKDNHVLRFTTDPPAELIKMEDFIDGLFNDETVWIPVNSEQN